MIDLDVIKARAEALPPLIFHAGAHWASICYPPDPSLNNGEPVVGDLMARRTELVTFFTHAQPDILALITEVERLRRIEAAARAHLAEWESGDTMAHESRKALKQALESES